MSLLVACFICCITLGLVNGRAVMSESPTSSDLNNDLAVIRFCNLTSPISLESMNSILVNRQLSGVENVDGFKCFLHCLYYKYNWMDEEGEFSLANMKSSLEASRLDELAIDWIIFKCSAVDSLDRCERAFKFTECFWEETKEFENEDDSALYRTD
ncbi:general odorant-binding protein 57c isoform X2 [Zootermopsis nevadensis]|uniref:Uncharacterized protein n=1 Tax=Zootermopsis nevadensis TaxID=136037 RepID=A0A067RAN6_ZOONE|nr:general odorant-binding protein 57c isoform X2 [Zootermopsis nevadensis]KDR16734.1 hypothetical protein L798_09261 [Zootermopsis nevadensis]